MIEYSCGVCNLGGISTAEAVQGRVFRDFPEGKKMNFSTSGLAAIACGASAALLLASTASAQSTGTIWGLSSDFSAGNALYTIDSTTGVATLQVTLTGTVGTSLVGLEYLNGVFYGTDVFDGNSFTFGSIDPTTGAYTVINDQAGSLNWHALAGDADVNLLYTVDQDDGNQLKSVTTGGVVTAIGGSGGPDMRGLAFDNDSDILYGIDGNGSLYTIDTGTGISALVGSTGVPGGQPGLAYDDLADILYLNDGAGQSLYTVDTTTGAATLVGGNAAGAVIDGLAFVPVPEPTSLGLILGGVAFAGLRRRRA